MVLGAVIGISFLLGIAMLRATRSIPFYAANSDNELIVRAAAKFDQWGWPSGMHRFANGKARMKEVAVLALAGMQKILNDKTTDFPLVGLCVVSNTISAILLYLIGANYWNEGAALLVFSLFIISFWHQLIALWGGVVAVSQLFCLLSIYFIQLGETAFPWYFAAGCAIGLMLFSSASSRKYLPLSLAALFYSLRGKMFFSVSPDILSSKTGLMALGLAGLMLLALLILQLFLAKIIKFMYLNGRIKDAGNKGPEAYLKLAKKLKSAAWRWGGLTCLYLTANLLLSRSIGFWGAQVLVLAGMAAVGGFLYYPNFVENFIGYFSYMQYGKPVWRNRFYYYREYFASIGKPIKEDMRGAGWSWLIKYFNLMAPLQSWLFIASIIIVFLTSGLNVNSIAVVLISLSPVLMGEFSRGVQVGRSYYPGLLGLLFLIGYADFILKPPAVIYSAVILSAFWNLWIYLTDISPARMAIPDLIKTLRRRGIKKIYTYHTPYNDVLVNGFPEKIKEQLQIVHINSIKDIKEGLVVVPGTNSRSLNMCDSPLARTQNTKFEVDPYLNQLIESKDIEHYALASFKTFGASRFWVHENEVPSYRDLILGEIGENDLWRGRAWLLDGNKLKI